MSTTPISSTVVMSAVPAETDAGAVVLDATLSPEVTALSGAPGSLTEIDPVSGSMTLAPESGEKGLMLQSSGRTFNIGFKTDKQRETFNTLYDELTAGYGPDAVINVSKGWVEVKGRIVEYLNEDPKSDKAKSLHKLRMLYHEILGQRYSDIVWHDYKPNDRASNKDPLPFQQRQNVDALKNLKDYSPESIPAVAGLKEFHFTRKLHKGVIDLIDKQRGTIDTRHDAESRKAQLTRAKEKYEKLDEWILGYHAAHPLPDLSLLDTSQKKYDAIAEYRDAAKTFLTEAVAKNDSLAREMTHLSLTVDSKKPQVQEAIGKLAEEMALSACTTRKDYDLMCLAFETKPNKTSPELFIIRLSHLAVTGGNVNQLIDEQFDIAFPGLTYEEDQLAIHDGLGRLVNEIQTELSDGRLNDVSTYSARIEQLEMVKKQGILANAQNKLAEKLDALNRPDLSNAATKAHELTADLEMLKADLNGVQPTLEAYKPFAERMQGQAQKQEELIKQLESNPDQTGLKAVINRLRGIQQHQTALGTFVSDKVDSTSTIKRGLNKIRHGVIPLGQIGAHLDS